MEVNERGPLSDLDLQDQDNQDCDILKGKSLIFFLKNSNEKGMKHGVAAGIRREY